MIVAGIIYFVRILLDQKAIIPLLVAALMIVFVWLVVRVPFFYSVLMVATGYIGFLFIESTLLFLFDYLKIIFVERVLSLSNQGHIFAVITNLVMFTLSWWLYRRGYGFAFSFQKVAFRKRETILSILVIALAALAVGMFYYSTIYGHRGLLVAAVINILSLSALLFISLRREYENNA
jgi:hypothetical protein